MRRMMLATLVSALWLAAQASGQEPAGNQAAPLTLSLGQLTPTPEMWFYEQQRALYNDPNFQVRQQAELRAEQRRRRLETRRWFGYSNLRPVANSTPVMGSYSPMWHGNGDHPYHWFGTGGTTVRAASRTGFMGLW